MDGQGRWRDNVFIERLWKTVKYEEVYLKAYESITEAKKELRKFFDRYNVRRRHQILSLMSSPKLSFYNNIFMQHHGMVPCSYEQHVQ
jgi:putative transposase